MDALSQEPGVKPSTRRDVFWSLADAWGLHPVPAIGGIEIVIHLMNHPRPFQPVSVTLGIYGLLAVAPAYLFQHDDFDKGKRRPALTKALLVGLSIGSPLLGVPLLGLLGIMGTLVLVRRRVEELRTAGKS